MTTKQKPRRRRITTQWAIKYDDGTYITYENESECWSLFAKKKVRLRIQELPAGRKGKARP